MECSLDTQNPLNSCCDLESDQSQCSEIYAETLEFFNRWMSIREISKNTWIKSSMIEWCILKLYNIGEIEWSDILLIVDYDKLKKIKKVIDLYFAWVSFDSKDVKEKLKELGSKNISYFEIEICIAMMKKDDM